MKFRSCPTPTVGVEWELQLLNAQTFDLVDGIMPLMELYPATPYVKPELVQSCVEVNSGICADSRQAGRRLRAVLLNLDRRCRELDMRLCGSGTHPFSRRLALITPLPRYLQSEQQYGYLAHQQITFALHVHVGLPSGDVAIRVMRDLAAYIPLLLAVSANSPFWRGYDTAFACYRQRILAASRTFGLPETFADWSDFEAFMRAARRAGVVDSIRDVHWDIRPHPDFGTLELRVMDAPSTLRQLVGLTAFARTLMVWLARAGESAHRLRAVPAWLARQNYFEASRGGMDQDIAVSADGVTATMREILSDVLQDIESTAQDLGELGAIAYLRDVLTGGAGYEVQRKMGASGNPSGVAQSLAGIFRADLDDPMPPAA